MARIVSGFLFLFRSDPCHGFDGDDVRKAVRTNSRSCSAMVTTCMEEEPIHTNGANSVFSPCGLHFDVPGNFPSHSWIGGVSESSFNRYVVSDSWNGSMGWNVAKRTLYREIIRGRERCQEPF